MSNEKTIEELKTELYLKASELAEIRNKQSNLKNQEIIAKENLAKALADIEEQKIYNTIAEQLSAISKTEKDIYDYTRVLATQLVLLIGKEHLPIGLKVGKDILAPTITNEQKLWKWILEFESANMASIPDYTPAFLQLNEKVILDFAKTAFEQRANGIIMNFPLEAFALERVINISVTKELEQLLQHETLEKEKEYDPWVSEADKLLF